MRTAGRIGRLSCTGDKGAVDVKFIAEDLHRLGIALADEESVEPGYKERSGGIGIAVCVGISAEGGVVVGGVQKNVIVYCLDGFIRRRVYSRRFNTGFGSRDTIGKIRKISISARIGVIGGVSNIPADREGYFYPLSTT